MSKKTRCDFINGNHGIQHNLFSNLSLKLLYPCTTNKNSKMEESITQLSFRGCMRRNVNSPQQQSRQISQVGCGLHAPSYFRTMDDPEEVTQWLNLIGMNQYTTNFRSNQITGSTLLYLNSVELRDTLKVMKLKDRRAIVASIKYLRKVLSSQSQNGLPEHGRILTHQSNVRILLSWFRFGIILQTMAVALVRILNLENRENQTMVTVVTMLTTVFSILAILYGSFRYFWMYQLVEDPGRNKLPEPTVVVTPMFILIISVLIALYGFLSEDTEQAALLALIAV